MQTDPLRQPYEVFVSCKQTGSTGARTRDSRIAEHLEHALETRGIPTFRADSALQQLGRPDYSKAIGEALEQARVLVVVGTSAENVASEWVRYEWDTFLNEVRSQRKRGQLVTVLESMSISQLPIELRQWQSFEVEDDKLGRPCDFVSNAIAQLRSKVALERSERLVETGGRAVEKVDRLGRAMAESRLTELEIFRRFGGFMLSESDLGRIDAHIEEIRRLLEDR